MVNTITHPVMTTVVVLSLLCYHIGTTSNHTEGPCEDHTWQQRQPVLDQTLLRNHGDIHVPYAWIIRDDACKVVETLIVKMFSLSEFPFCILLQYSVDIETYNRSCCPYYFC